jgi:uncharacterized protein (DUF433 family)
LAVEGGESMSATTKALIAKYIEENPYHPGPADVRLQDACVPVWALILYWKAAEEDSERVAADYSIPRDAVDAAVAYYRQHTAVIEARLAANRT